LAGSFSQAGEPPVIQHPLCSGRLLRVCLNGRPTTCPVGTGGRIRKVWTPSRLADHSDHKHPITGLDGTSRRPRRRGRKACSGRMWRHRPDRPSRPRCEFESRAMATTYRSRSGAWTCCMGSSTQRPVGLVMSPTRLQPQSRPSQRPQCKKVPTV
jgi:hypothetical protein